MLPHSLSLSFCLYTFWSALNAQRGDGKLRISTLNGECSTNPQTSIGWRNSYAPLPHAARFYEWKARHAKAHCHQATDKLNNRCNWRTSILIALIGKWCVAVLIAKLLTDGKKTTSSSDVTLVKIDTHILCTSDKIMH